MLKTDSHLIDLGPFFQGMDDYVILRLPESFPSYRDHGDIDILCGDRDRFLRHILDVGKTYEDQGFRIETTPAGSHLHVDFLAPGAQRLNLRFDLISSFDYEKFKIAPKYAEVVLASGRHVSPSGVSVRVPSVEHDLAIRFLEYLEHADKRPDKIKHLEYVKSHFHPGFVDVVNQYTDLQIALRQGANGADLTVSRKRRQEKASHEDVQASQTGFYHLSDTCQIPDLAAIYERQFGRRTDGCFVEVGAFDGEYASNTSGLADLGWTGYYIEPVPEYFERCTSRHAKNSKVTVSQLAIGPEPAAVDIHVGGPLSTISDQAKRNFQSLDWARGYFQQERKVAVQQTTLDDYLRRNGIQPGFELLVVDVEGYEWNVFRNFDIEDWRPQMVIVELHDQNDDYLVLREDCRNLAQYLADHKYESIYKDASNAVYIAGARAVSKPRMDYFMIWGHGVQFTREILGMIRDVDAFQIVAITQKKITNIEKFVQDIYACDTVPFKHLVSKTRYLLTTPPEIVFILVRNNSPQEQYFGEGAFRHIQCRRVKDLKEAIRNRFNPRKDGQRTEDHVVHASDYESQVEHVLKVLGMPPIEHYSRRPHRELDVPFHIRPFDKYAIRDVPIDALRANILGVGLVPVVETPHYKYLVGDEEAYEAYHERYCGHELVEDHFPEAYDRMIASFQYDYVTVDGRRSLILAQRIDDSHYRILDGVHRAAIIKHRGAATVTIAEPLYAEPSSSDRPSTVGLIFSKDRALQLRAAMESFLLCCGDADRLDLCVLYTTSGPRHSRQYEQLKAIFPQVTFVEQADFKGQVLSILDGRRYALFLVDDSIFVRPVRMEDVTQALQGQTDAIGFSLRLGTNTTYCYALGLPQELPPFTEVSPDILKYAWSTAQHDFGYPLEVSSSVFRTADILPLLRKLDFHTPNRLEAALHRSRAELQKSLPTLLMFRESVAFCNPVNVVQHEFANRHGNTHSYTSEDLASRFEQGLKIDVESYIGCTPGSVHQEAELHFCQASPANRPGVAAQHRNGPLVTVYTVAYNAGRYIRRAIESVLAQDYGNIEYLIIDDGSTDDTRHIVSSYHDPRLTYVHREHRNFASGMNEAIRRAKGTFIMGVDADDYVDPGYVRYMVEFAVANPGHDYYYPQKLAHVDDGDRPLSSCYLYREYAGSDEVLRRVFHEGCGVIPNPGSLKRRTLYDRTGLYRETDNVEDFVYLTEHALDIRYKLVPNPPRYAYRQVEGLGNSHRYDAKHRVMAEAMYNMILGNDPLVLCPELRNVSDPLDRRRELLMRAAEVMEGHAKRYEDRCGWHFQQYAGKIREKLQESEDAGRSGRADVVAPSPGAPLKIAILAHKNNLSFMGEILAHLRASHDVWVVDCNEKKDISRALETTDVCWIEWATEFAVRVTKQPRRCRTILRLHSFEAFCHFPKEIHWENVDDLIFVSPYIRDVLKEQVPDIETRVRTHVVPNCVDLGKFRFNDRPRGKSLAFVGSLRPAKNLPFLMQCLREIRAADPGYTLHIAGELFGDELHQGELKHYLEHIERELGIQGHVFYYGRVEDVSSWLNDKDFILSTSIREGHPVNIIEGMAKGLKPVIHNYPGVKSCYPEKWIFNTSQECRDIVLSADFDRRECLAYVQERWSTEQVLPQIDTILQSTAANRPQNSTFGPSGAQTTRSGPVSSGRPKVTVITACYEAEAFLPQCVDSILGQTMPEWELFLLDDGSTDGTRRIMEDYARRDPRIKAFCFDDNKGPYVRRNYAIERAAADFIVIHDADDIMAPNKLERLHEAITEDDRLGIVGSFYRMFLDGSPDVDHTEDVTLATTHEQISDMYRTYGTSDFCPHGIAIICKKLFEEIGLYDENPFGSDSFWLLKAVEYACRMDEVRFKNIPEFLTLRRMHLDSQTEKLPSFDPRSPRAKFCDYRRSQIQKLRERLDANPNADIRAELRGSVCNDFVARPGHLFPQWAKEPLTSRIAEEFIARIFSQFTKRQFVRCIETCEIVERLVEGVAHSVRCYDLVRGLAYFALALPEQSRQCLHREFETHGTWLARDFCREYLERQDASWTRAHRHEIVCDAVFGKVGTSPTPAAAVRPTKPLMDSRNGHPVQLSIVIEVGEDAAQCRELFLQLNEQPAKAFEVIALVPPACRQVLEPLMGQLDFGVAIMAREADASQWEQRNAAAAHARGQYIAFLGEQMVPENGLVQAVLARFGKYDINGLRGRIVAGMGEDLPCRYDLGETAVYAACDTDEFCAFRKDTFARLGGFPPTPFQRGAIQLSYRTYTDQEGPQRPILYCPEITVHSMHPQRQHARLIDEFALENRFCIEHLKGMRSGESGEEQTELAFLRFVESLYPAQERTEEEYYSQCKDNALFFERLFPAIAVGWGERALAYKPDSLKSHYMVGASYARLAKPDRAHGHFEAILDSLEDQLALGRLDRAQSEFRDYTNLGECYVASCTLLAQCYAQQNRYEDVHRVYDRLLGNSHVTIPQDQKRKIQNVQERLNRVRSSPLTRGAGHRAVSPRGINGCVTPKEADPVRTASPRPKVTVVTACHNCEEHLPECIDSIRGQAMQEWELFLLDDGSTDRTREIIDRYARLDPRIRPHYFEDNRGPYVRRDFAIAQAASDFIVIQDADDIMSPAKLETLHREITRDSHLAMVGSCYRTFLDQWRGLEYTECNNLPLAHEEIVERFTSWRHTMSHGSAIIRKALFDEVGPYDENPFASDSFWSAKLGEYIRQTGCWKVKNVPEYLTFIRMHAASQTHQLSTFDPRSRRARYRLYCECRLQKIREKMQAAPGGDIRRELRDCDCSDFLVRFRAQIPIWESEPLDNRLVPQLLENAVWLFNHSYHISCVSMLNGIEAMDRGVAGRMRNFDLLRAMSLHALDMKDQSLSCLHREIENHDSEAAREFLRDYVERGVNADVRQWCADHGDRFDLEMIDTERATQETAVAQKP
jgi:FkbM family methyltransferase